jgi:hypothetical protein
MNSRSTVVSRNSMLASLLFLISLLWASQSVASVPPAHCADLMFPGGTATCHDYSGADWNPVNAETDCATPLPGSTGPGSLVVGSYCPTDGLGGTCSLNTGSGLDSDLHFYTNQASVLEILETNCENYMGGTWSAALVGSCQHDMVFGPPGTPPISVCTQYDGADWDPSLSQTDCEALPAGVFMPGASCPDSPVGYCTLGASTPDQKSIFFPGGDPATLAAGCEAPSPYGLSGVWTSAQIQILDPVVVQALQSDDLVNVTPDDCTDDICLEGVMAQTGAIIFAPATQSASVGLVIYPGAMIEPRAYAVAARKVAEAGYLVALVPFPGNLAINDPMRGQGVTMAHPEVNAWVVAGHSLGGTAASIWAAANPMGKLQGIAFWASYPAPAMGPNPPADLSNSGLKALSVTADLDSVLNWDAYQTTQGLLPAQTRFVSIRGGNHAQFGYYGDQDGDTPARISAEFQHDLFVGATLHTLARLGVPAEDDLENPDYALLSTDAAGVCQKAQKLIGHFRGKDLKLSQIESTLVPYQTDFAASKPYFHEEGPAMIGVRAHAAQVPNPADISAPPVLEGEVWCKMKTQEAIQAEYDFDPSGAEKLCRHVNEQVFRQAEDWLWMNDPDTYDDYLVSDTWLLFISDYDAIMGPDWLAHGVTLTETALDTYTLQASRLRTSLDTPPPYAGNYYCRVWSLEAAAQFMIQAGAWSVSPQSANVFESGEISKGQGCNSHSSKPSFSPWTWLILCLLGFRRFFHTEISPICNKMG